MESMAFIGSVVLGGLLWDLLKLVVLSFDS